MMNFGRSTRRPRDMVLLLLRMMILLEAAGTDTVTRSSTSAK